VRVVEEREFGVGVGDSGTLECGRLGRGGRLGKLDRIAPNRWRDMKGTPKDVLMVLDCDTLIVAADDLRIMIYTAEPDTEDAERLALAVVLGTQSLVD
jgi:hypothetical protein